MSLNGRVTLSAKIADMAEHLSKDGESVAELLNEIGKRLWADPDRRDVFKKDFRMCVAEHGHRVLMIMKGR